MVPSAPAEAGGIDLIARKINFFETVIDGAAVVDDDVDEVICLLSS